MKKIIVLVSVFSMLLLSSCGNGEKVYIDGAEADGFKVEGAATPTPVPTVAPEDRDFRGMKWGMSLSDVTNSEGEGYTTVSEGVIRYNNLKVGGFPVQSEYTFEGNKLATCIYYTTHTHTNTKDFIGEYKTMLDRYKKKYDTPQYSEQKWADGTQTEDETKIVEGLEKGAMMYRSGWEIGNTRINLVLFKDTDAKIKIGIRYSAIDINGQGEVAPEGDIEI